jgi:hypothetical protein
MTSNRNERISRPSAQQILLRRVAPLAALGLAIVGCGGSSPAGSANTASYVYWANRAIGTIGRARLDGMDVERALVTGIVAPCGVAVAGGYIYWASDGGGAVGRARTDGTSVNAAFIRGVGADTCGVAVRGKYIYWASNDLGAVGRANLDGTDARPNFIHAPDANGIAIEGQHLYWGTVAPFLAASKTVGRANLDGTGVNRASSPAPATPACWRSTPSTSTGRTQDPRCSERRSDARILTAPA